MVVIRTAEHYAEQLQALLPPGPAWDPERVPELQQVITGLSRESPVSMVVRLTCSTRWTRPPSVNWCRTGSGS